MRWIQVSQSELETTHTTLNPEFGYQLIDNNGEPRVNFMRTTLIVIRQRQQAIEQLVGKNPSMSSWRALSGLMPIAVFGQGETVFSQFIFPTKSWIGPNQEHGLFSKSSGEGLMILACVSRDSGFGIPVSSVQMGEINCL